MSDYSKTTNFTAKDALPTGNPSKVIKGSEHDTEFDNISTAVATKANKIASATDDNLVTMDATGDIKDSTIATDGAGTITANLTGDVTGSLTGNADTATLAADATTLATARDFSATGAMETSANQSFDGSAAVVLPLIVPAATAGTTLTLASSIGATASPNTNPTLSKTKEIFIPYAGTFTISYDMDGTTQYARLYHNGVAAAGSTLYSSGPRTATQTLAVAAGDYVQVYSHCSSDGCSGDTISNFLVQAADSTLHFVVTVE